VGASSLEDRFWSKVAIGGPDDCWLWQAAKLATGYGQFEIRHGKGYRDRKNYKAHRVAWELENGPPPEGMHVCHKCDVRLCCNPAHLFVGTRTDNERDKVAKGRHHETRKDACPAGHQYTAANTYEYRGRRNCRACGVARKAAWRSARRVA
jgi:hypothetical protein